MKYLASLMCLLLSVFSSWAQHKYSSLFGYFPDNLSGFVSDPHQVYTEDDGTKRYTNVSRMYFKPDGSCQVEIRLKDFSLNPISYQDSWDDLKSRDESYSLKDGRPFMYGKYNCLEKRSDSEALWVLFLGDFVLLEIDMKGFDSNRDWIRSIAADLNMDAMRLAFAATRVTK